METNRKEHGPFWQPNLTGIFVALLFLCVFGLSVDMAWADDSGKTEEPGPASTQKADSSSKSGFETDVVVCLIDVTVGSESVSGNTEPVGENDHYQNELYVDGRVAFYLKGKIKGKYLLTMQMDTGEGPIDKIFTDMDRKVFDKIDPDKYYPIYGDDSTTVNDADSLGKIFVRLEWDKSRVLLGNYQVSMNGAELARYNRSLYGLDMRFYRMVSSGADQEGAELFWAEPQTMHSRDELRSTGTALYYMKHGSIVIGSEQIHVEVRDSVSGQVLRSYTLVYGTDYTFDYSQGRLILKRDLKTMISSGLITSNLPMDNNLIYLIADYEFDGGDDTLHNSSYGVRANYSLTEGWRVGGSYIRENKDNGNDYTLYGIDSRIDLGPNLTFTGELFQSESSPSNRFFSTDGGLTFQELMAVGVGQTAEAWKVGMNAKLSDRFSLKISSMFQEQNFAAPGSQVLHDTTGYGLELNGRLTDNQWMLLKIDYYDEADTSSKSTGILQFGQDVGKFTFTEEIRYQTYLKGVDDYQDSLGAVRVDYRISDAVSLFGTGQTTLAHNDTTPENNRVGIGADISINDKTQMELETSQGDLGDYSRLGLNYQTSADGQVYGEFRNDTDFEGGNTFTSKFGNRGKISRNVGVFAERQMSTGDYEDSTSDIFGFTYTPNSKWSFSLDVAKGIVDVTAIRPIFDYPYSPAYPDPTSASSLGLVDRRTLGLGIFYTFENLEFKTRFQWRRDDGTEELRQNTVLSSLKWQMSTDTAFLMGWKYSFTNNITLDQGVARFAEGKLGLAYRPVKNDRFNMLWEYIYWEEISPETMIDGILPGERSHTFSLDINYDLTARWQLGEKLAFKRTEVIDFSSEWDRSQVYLWVNRLNYKVVKRWDILGEYRILWNDLADDTKSGFLLAVYYDFSQNAKLGAGYNFTDFNDDLTHLDYNEGGWFINMIGKW